MNEDTQLLLRYVDREMSALEAERFAARLRESPELARQMREMQQVGVELRRWSNEVEGRADGLLEATLERVRGVGARRRQKYWLGYGVAALALVALRASATLESPTALDASAAPAAAGAAIERIELTQPSAQVFMVGSSATPVVWLADDAQDDQEPSDQDPG